MWWNPRILMVRVVPFKSVFSSGGPMIDSSQKSVDYNNYSDDQLWKYVIDYIFLLQYHKQN